MHATRLTKPVAQDAEFAASASAGDRSTLLRCTIDEKILPPIVESASSAWGCRAGEVIRIDVGVTGLPVDRRADPPGSTGE